MMEPTILPDEPGMIKAYDPRTTQGMINALTFFAREHGKNISIEPGTGRVSIEKMGGADILLRPTDSKLETRFIVVSSVSQGRTMALSIFNPDKVEYKEGEPIKFYARDPSAVLTIEAIYGGVKVDLKATDTRRPDRVHGGTMTCTD